MKAWHFLQIMSFQKQKAVDPRDTKYAFGSGTVLKSAGTSPNPGSVAGDSFSSANLLVSLRIPDRRNRPFYTLIWQVDVKNMLNRRFLFLKNKKSS
jgi:hypothetical protein